MARSPQSAGQPRCLHASTPTPGLGRRGMSELAARILSNGSDEWVRTAMWADNETTIDLLGFDYLED